MLTTISLVMVKENGEWRLDDFGDGIKEQCKGYIQKQVGDFISGRITQYIKAYQQENWYTDEHIAKVQKAFEEYIDENTHYLPHTADILYNYPQNVHYIEIIFVI